MGGTVRAEPDGACHDLLVRLAGRLPDRLLWRLREWLATGGQAEVATLLPRALLRHRVELSEAERDLLEEAVADRGAPRRLLDAVLTVSVPDEPAAVFEPGPSDPDLAALSLLAVARGDDGCVELRQAMRIGDGRTGGGRPQRVVLVRASGGRPWVLAATLQRLLRVHGDPTPCVEVLPADHPPAYHRAALAASTVLWRRPDAVPTGG
jgi:hypothetical protein